MGISVLDETCTLFDETTKAICKPAISSGTRVTLCCIDFVAGSRRTGRQTAAVRVSIPEEESVRDLADVRGRRSECPMNDDTDNEDTHGTRRATTNLRPRDRTM